MTLEDTALPPVKSPSLSEAATQFLVGISFEQGPLVQQEVYKFVRWYGGDRSLSEITAPEIASYAEMVTSSDAEGSSKLVMVKAFLNYAYKEALTRTNLATHLKVKKKTPNKSSVFFKQGSSTKSSLTSEGYAALEAELAALKNERPRVAEELRKAAADKDFRENAPLDAAREYQGFLEARIRELESVLKSATIMNGDGVVDRGDKIVIGDTVVLRDLSSGEQIQYMLVDPREVSLEKGKISIASPTGKMLIGQEKGAIIEVAAPVGIFRYSIEMIER